MINKSDIKHLAALSRINISAGEEEGFAEDIERILEYAGKLNALNLQNVSPTTHAEELINVFRTDKEPSASGAVSKDLTGQFPDSSKGFLKVKKVFENE